VLSAAHRGAWSSLGLEREAAARAAAMAATVTEATAEDERLALEHALMGLWGTPVALVPPARLAPLDLVRALLEPGDAVLVAPGLSGRHRRAIEALRAAGKRVETAPAPDELPGRMAALAAVGARGWYVADTFEPHTGQVAPLDALWDLHDRCGAMRLVLDDTHGLGWHGRSGRGLALESAPPAARLIVMAELATGLGIELGAIAAPDPALVQAVRLANPIEAFSASTLAVAGALSDLEGAAGWAAVQARLRKRLQLCDRLLKAHRLPRLGPASVPHRYVAAGTPTVAYAMVARLLTEGHLVSAATVRTPAGPQPALRFSLSLARPVEALQALVEAFSRHLPEAFAEAGLSLSDWRQAHGWEAPAVPGDMVDLAAWRASRASDRQGVKAPG
jgi:7-keto-8-aminopelargonate synthetase-like enzyme